MVPAINSIANKCFFIFSDFLEFDIQTDTVRPGWRRLQISTDTDTVTIVGESTGYNGVTGISEFRIREMRSFTEHGERVTRNNPDGKILDKIPAGYNRLRQRVVQGYFPDLEGGSILDIVFLDLVVGVLPEAHSSAGNRNVRIHDIGPLVILIY